MRIKLAAHDPLGSIRSRAVPIGPGGRGTLSADQFTVFIEKVRTMDVSIGWVSIVQIEVIRSIGRKIRVRRRVGLFHALLRGHFVGATQMQKKDDYVEFPHSVTIGPKIDKLDQSD
jgi:hypothetical protein